MSSKVTLTIEDHFLIGGRGLVVIPMAFRFVTPGSAAVSFSDTIEIISAGATSWNTVASFLFEHFSMKSDSGDLFGRYSLVLLLPEQVEALPPDCRIQITETTLERMKGMVRNPESIFIE